ncbi:MAG: hypothetical protein AABX44_00310 [Nanoarchaeota archaeon]
MINNNGEKIVTAILEEIERQQMECHTDGPAYNDQSGDPQHENWNNNN